MTLDFNKAFHLPERLAFWDKHPLVGVMPIVLPCTHKPFVMYLENDDTVVKTLYWAGFFAGWEASSLRLWSALAANARSVLDIGAYTGIYGLLAATTNAQATVYCFEGSRRNFERVRKNVTLNGLSDRITSTHAIVCDKDGEGVLYEIYAAGNILSSVHSITKQKGTPTAVRSVSLDGFFEGNDQIDLIKIDVEGAEEMVLKGAQNVLARCLPDLLLEANSPVELEKTWGFVPPAYTCFSIAENMVTVNEVKRTDLALLSRLSDRNFLFSAKRTQSDLRALITA